VFLPGEDVACRGSDPVFGLCSGRVSGGGQIRFTVYAAAGDDGTFIVQAIAEGKLTVYPQVDQALPARPRPFGDVEIWSDQSTKFAMFAPKAVRVRGSIRVQDSREPVAGASIAME